MLKSPRRFVSNKNQILSIMTATNAMKESVLEFSRAYSAEPESRVAEAGYAPGGSTDQPLGAKMFPGNAPLGNTVQLQPWDAWLSRGIPELASPLAG
jgi:hypothetical protein